MVLKRCFYNGPGADINYYADLISFFLQIFLVWLCFFLLPCSKPKGKPKFVYSNEENTDLEDDINNCFCCNFVIERFLLYKK